MYVTKTIILTLYKNNRIFITTVNLSKMDLHKFRIGIDHTCIMLTIHITFYWPYKLTLCYFSFVLLRWATGFSSAMDITAGNEWLE